MFRHLLIHSLSLAMVVALGLFPSQGSASTDQPAARLLMVSPEQLGIHQTGGLAHATSGLSEALQAAGLPVHILMPLPRGKQANSSVETTSITGLKTFLIEHPAQGPVSVYSSEAGAGKNFALFARAASEFILRSDYDVILLHDWPSALIAPVLRQAEKLGKRIPKMIFVAHNFAYQGIYPARVLEFAGLPVPLAKEVNFLREALMNVDKVITVSKPYARELMTKEKGMGLDELVRELHDSGRFAAINNGASLHLWRAQDALSRGLPFAFSPDDLSGKIEGKRWLQKRLGLNEDGRSPLFIFTSRLAAQKGFDFIFSGLETALQQSSMQVAVLGDGDIEYVRRAREMAAKWPGRFYFAAFSNQMEQALTAYADFFVNAAWFEPSGQNQFFAMVNGTIPVLSPVGGLLDSVVEGESGFFIPFTQTDSRADVLAKKMVEVARLYSNSPEKIRAMAKKAMAQDNTWERRVREEYLPLIQKILISPGLCEQHLVSRRLGP